MISSIPFVGLLLSIGIFSFISVNYPQSILAHFWEKNRNKLLISILWSIPALIFLKETHQLLQTLEEYFSFISLLFTLFVISGGIYLEGNLVAKPITNTALLGIGAILASLMGTTGASMLLIRPLLKTNQERQYIWHIPLFFISIVANCGGLLLPIGDPPLFMGYLRGVPFFWTLSLFPIWLFVNGILLIVFYIWDSIQYKKETEYHKKLDVLEYVKLKIHGKINFLWIIGVLLSVIFLTPNNIEKIGLPNIFKFSREIVMLMMAALSLLTTPLNSISRKGNNFNFFPIIEVAVIFIGIFITMIFPIEFLRNNPPKVHDIWAFYWMTGFLSSFLDNAPTYLVYFAMVQGIHFEGLSISPQLAVINIPDKVLAAISAGAVFFGANTYIGNGPNFMVKAIAEYSGYKMPDFFTYIIKWTFPVLLPIFLITTLIFFI